MKDGYYTSGEFAREAHVTLRTIRWYDKQNLLKPSAYTETGNRLYTAQDLVKLQQILLFKYLGFSLEDIREMTMTSQDSTFLEESLSIQKKLVQERIEELKQVSLTLDDTLSAVQQKEDVDWNAMLNLIHMTSAEQSLKNQYLDATNISSRIRLHHEYSVNKQGWFPWVYKQCEIQNDMKVLEIGCGNGALWKENYTRIPDQADITLSDISEGMLRDAGNSIPEDNRFTYMSFDCTDIPFADQSFDLVIANHVLFYCDDIEKVLQECRRVLKKDGKLICSTYSHLHMHEITDLVKNFDENIVLAADSLFERFGLENGEEILKPFFTDIQCRRYEDAIEINEAEPLIAYILSCHGNQNRILLDHYKEFRQYVISMTESGFHITKDAGIFICRK